MDAGTRRRQGIGIGWILAGQKYDSDPRLAIKFAGSSERDPLGNMDDSGDGRTGRTGYRVSWVIVELVETANRRN